MSSSQSDKWKKKKKIVWVKLQSWITFVCLHDCFKRVAWYSHLVAFEPSSSYSCHKYQHLWAIKTKLQSSPWESLQTLSQELINPEPALGFNLYNRSYRFSLYFMNRLLWKEIIQYLFLVQTLSGASLFSYSEDSIFFLKSLPIRGECGQWKFVCKLKNVDKCLSNRVLNFFSLSLTFV